MSSNNALRTAIGQMFYVTAMAAVLGISPAAVAQDDAAVEELEEITVTGTRITNPNVEAASPITSIGMDEINLNFVYSYPRSGTDFLSSNRNLMIFDPDLIAKQIGPSQFRRNSKRLRERARACQQ